MSSIIIGKEKQTISIEEDEDGVEKEIDDDDQENENNEPPFEPAKIRIQTKILTIDSILFKVKKGALNLESDFQRPPLIWSKVAQSRLIESILVRIPLPSFYIDASDEDEWLIVDGLQRLSTLKAFVLDKNFKLTGLEYLKKFNNKGFDELPRNYQRRIEETEIIVNSIEQDTPENVKFHIFKRINTGGLPLSSQEIRHVIYQGKATQLLKKLSNSKDFQETIGVNKDDKEISNKLVFRMGDQEFILRFLAFHITPYTEYKKNSLEDLLSSTMNTLNKSSDGNLSIYEQKFYSSIILAKKIFGEFSFRKLTRNNKRKYPPNKALFEVWLANFANLDSNQQTELEIRKEKVYDKFLDLIDYSGETMEMQEKCIKFNKAITYGTSQVQQVRYRFRCIEELIQEVLK
jgi:hypothetical protein